MVLLGILCPTGLSKPWTRFNAKSGGALLAIGVALPAALSDDALREALQVDSVLALLRKSRLRYFARLARDGAPMFLLSLIQNAGGSAPTPWVTMMLDDPKGPLDC